MFPLPNSCPDDGLMDASRASKRRRSVSAHDECLTPASRIARPAPSQSSISDVFRASSSEKSYTSALRTIDKVYGQWLKKYKPSAGQFLAFNLVLDIGKYASGDIDYGPKFSGHGGTRVPFRAMDQLLEDIIQARLRQDPATLKAEEPLAMAPAAIDMGTSHKKFQELLKPKGILNKKQETQRIALRRADQHLLKERQRSRRMHAVDWVGNALNDLCETRERIEAWGIVGHSFTGSILRLCGIKGWMCPKPSITGIVGENWSM
ncbi:hypothetical protein DL764_000442 [Monosporascus ibericus]|uniref:Uncharacterized protein n=1 Tax=Monosporascus ibericus TaxID=155417 RepID=A0A4Q4TYS3_9PEZI|nr:hypothetical protein DL764_000442 [Monosporascus ibericus]